MREGRKEKLLFKSNNIFFYLENQLLQNDYLYTAVFTKTSINKFYYISLKSNVIPLKEKDHMDASILYCYTNLLNQNVFCFS